MLDMKTKPDEIWNEYEKCREYNRGIGLYDKVKQNEEFYLGNQWNGINAPDLDKPVLNFLKRVTTFFVSIVSSNNVGISLAPAIRDTQHIVESNILTDVVNQVIEDNSLTEMSTEFVRDAAVTGDMCCYFYYDPDKRTVIAERIDNTRILFGSPQVLEIQDQEYIIIEIPMTTKKVKAIAKAAGLKQSEIDSIQSDDNELQENMGSEHIAEGTPARTIVLIKFWRDEETKTIHFTKTTKTATLQKQTDTGYKLFPVAYKSWERNRDSYHGQAVITGLIPTQIAINKLRAMQLLSLRDTAFPTRYYDKTKIPHWQNRPGTAIGIAGSPKEAISVIDRPGDMSNQVSAVCTELIEQTKELMGASDAALGEVKPDNTSAILAVQKASSAPLEIQKINHRRFLEACVRIIIEILLTDDIPRYRTIRNEDGEQVTAFVDLTEIQLDQFSLRVDVGESAYWGELMENQTLEALFTQQVIPAELFIEEIPDSRLPRKGKILDYLKNQREQGQILEQGAQTSADGAINQNNILKQLMATGSTVSETAPQLNRAQSFIRNKDTQLAAAAGARVGAQYV